MKRCAVILLLLLLIFFVSLVSSGFEYSIWKSDISGRLGFQDMNDDGYEDILVHEWGTNRGVVTDGSLSWYDYDSWNKNVIKSNEHLYGDEIRVADFDSDGDLDVVGPIGQNYQSNPYWNAVVWYENGNNWMQREIYRLNDDSIKDIHIADFDNDRKPDIAVRYEKKLVVFYYNTKTSWTTQTVDIDVKEGMALGDVDSDGDLDVILNGYWLRNPRSKTGTWIRYDIDTLWYNNTIRANEGDCGNKAFNNCWRYNNARVAYADLDGDNVGEVIISHSENPQYPIRWYKNKTKVPTSPANWEVHTLINRYDYAHTLLAEDFDNDGDNDILVGSTTWAGGQYDNPDPSKSNITIFWNNGNAVFTQDKSLSGNNRFVYAGKTVDLENDGDLDFMSTWNWEMGPIQLWKNNIYSPNTNWAYKKIDSTRQSWGDFGGQPSWLRWFGLGVGDIDNDGDKDVVSGRYYYKNPGGNMQGNWVRTTFSQNLDGSIMVDLDGDTDLDIIGFALPTVYRIMNNDGQLGSPIAISTIQPIPATDHTNTQGYTVADIKQGGKPEILFDAGKGTQQLESIWAIEIPSNLNGVWNAYKVTSKGADGVSVADIDGDGDLDVVTGSKEELTVWWFENPGNAWFNNPSNPWSGTNIGELSGIPDKFATAYIDSDTKIDIIVSEETYPVAPGAGVYWYKNPTNPKSGSSWTRTSLLEGYSLNSLDVEDIDNNGYPDIITAEMGHTQRIFIAKNSGSGQFTVEIPYAGKECHGGFIVEDLNNDGKKDIICTSWNDYSDLYLWVNGGGNNNEEIFEDSGIVYKEFYYNNNNNLPNGVGYNGNWRVTDPQATNPGAQDFLPNPSLNLYIDDLQGATHAEIVIDFWGGHDGTTGKKFRFNNNPWIAIPELNGYGNCPTPANKYMQQVNYRIDVPINNLVQGNNLILGDSGPNGWGWGQWGWYGIILRVYYDPSKTDTIGQITYPPSGATLIDKNPIHLQKSESSEIEKIEVLAYYEGYDTDGDGVYRDWQHNYHKSSFTDSIDNIKAHVGTITTEPYELVWNTEWVPDQTAPVKLKARMKDTNGYWYETVEVTDLNFNRFGYSNKLFKATNVPELFWVRDNRQKSCNFENIPSLAGATSAKLFTKSWNGNDPDTTFSTKLNGWTTPPYGKDHFYGYQEITNNVLQNLNTGQNTFIIDSNTLEHGIEFMWPGPAIAVKYGNVVDPRNDGTCSLGEDCINSPNDCSCPSCGEGLISSPCVCGGNSKTYGFCCSGSWQTISCGGPEPPDPFIWHWPFEETSGTSITENCGELSAGNLNGATRENSDCKSGRCLSFDGVNDYANLGNLDVSGNEITISAWFKSSNLANCAAHDCRIISKASGTGEQDHYWMISPILDGGTTKLRFRLKAGGNTNTLVANTGTLSNNVWTHVVATYNGNIMKLYKDGQLVGSSSKSGSISENSGVPVWIGGNPTDSTIRPWKGKIDEVAIWNKALSDSEVLDIYPNNNINCVTSCGNGVCEGNLGEDCRTCEDDCGRCTFHPADKNEDGCVDMGESVLFIKERKLGQHSIEEVLSAMFEMKKGCN